MITNATRKSGLVSLRERWKIKSKARNNRYLVSCINVCLCIRVFLVLQTKRNLPLKCFASFGSGRRSLKLSNQFPWFKSLPISISSFVFHFCGDPNEITPLRRNLKLGIFRATSRPSLYNARESRQYFFRHDEKLIKSPCVCALPIAKVTFPSTRSARSWNEICAAHPMLGEGKFLSA